MEKIIDYTKLYSLQDEVLKSVFSNPTAFYLTGGTALHRFYCKFRYSDNLDFFMSGQAFFYDEVKEILYKLKNKFEFKTLVDTKDFIRISVENLQVDFVNDRVYRYGKSNLTHGFLIDNIYNILANKITAILGRDEEKDVFDLVSICKFYEFNWADILEIAFKKLYFEEAVLIERLTTFPLQWLQNLRLIKDISINDAIIKQICEDIKHKRNNSLLNI